MSKFWLWVAVALIASTQSAWGKANDHSATTSLAAEDRASQVIVLLLQSEIDFDQVGGTVMLSADPVTFLIGSLLDVSVVSTATKRRIEALAPIRNALLDFGFEDRLLASLRGNLPSAWVQPEASIDIARNEDDMRALLTRSVPGTVLVIGVRYALEQDLDLAYVHANASVLRYKQLPPTPKQAKAMKRAQRKALEPETLIQVAVQSDHAIYSLFDKKRPRGILAYRSHAAAWNRAHAAPIRSALEVSVQEVAELLRLKSEGLLTPMQDRKPQNIWLAQISGPPWVRKSQWIEPEGERPIIEFKSTIYRIDPKQVKP